MTAISLTCELNEDNTYNLKKPIENMLGEDWREKWELVRDEPVDVDEENSEVHVQAVFAKLS